MYPLLRGKGNSNLKIICSRCPSAALLKYIQINRMKPHTAVWSGLFHGSELSPIGGIIGDKKIFLGRNIYIYIFLSLMMPLIGGGSDL